MKDTRTKILRTAARLFAKKGFSGTSIRDIVSAAKENVSSINYHFGSKQRLYQATLEYLVNTFHQQVWSHSTKLLSDEEINALSYSEALQRLHQVLDTLIEQGFRREHLPLERIFTQVELESAPMRKMLLSYMVPFQERPLKLMQKLTGLTPKSPELVLVTHAIFSQVSLTECHRLAISHILGNLNHQPTLRDKVKQTIWKNTLSILNSYQQGKK